MALYISYKCLSHPGAGKRGAVGWGSFMSYKWNYFGEMLRRPNLSAHVPLASSVWQGRGLHCLNLAEQLIGVAVCHRGFPVSVPVQTYRSVLARGTSSPQTGLLVSFVLGRACG